MWKWHSQVQALWVTKVHARLHERGSQKGSGVRLTWKGSLPVRALTAAENSHSSMVGSVHSYGSLQVTCIEKGVVLRQICCE